MCPLSRVDSFTFGLRSDPCCIRVPMTNQKLDKLIINFVPLERQLSFPPHLFDSVKLFSYRPELELHLVATLHSLKRATIQTVNETYEELVRKKRESIIGATKAPPDPITRQ